MTPPDDFAANRSRVADQLAGLAGHHLRGGRLGEAARLLELARSLEPALFRVLMTTARLAILRGDSEAAIEALDEARAADPFDDEAADLLGQLRLERKENLSALEAFIDARLLGGGVDEERDAGLRAHEEGLHAKLGFTTDEARQDFVRERTDRLDELAEEVEAEAALAHAGSPGAAAHADTFSDDLALPAARRGLRASRETLRTATFFAGLSERELDLLIEVVEVVTLTPGEAVFRQGQPSEDLYVVESGTVRIQRETPFGSQELATVRRGSLFGEMNFIDGLTRSADAVAADAASLLRISHAGLRTLFESERGLAVAFLEEFWKALSDKVREGNDLMKSFFPAGPPAPAKQAGPAGAPGAGGTKAGVDAEDAANVLREKGISSREMEILAGFAEAIRFDLDQPVFREGEVGTRLYIVFQGRVRISKHIPGVGEEALAILDRGEFFGEMAIIDGSPRSASALAHESGTTVLAIDKSDMDRILSDHQESAYEFLFILCRILSGRLREINDKIVQWRMMSGSF